MGLANLGLLKMLGVGVAALALSKKTTGVSTLPPAKQPDGQLYLTALNSVFGTAFIFEQEAIFVQGWNNAYFVSNGIRYHINGWTAYTALTGKPAQPTNTYSAYLYIPATAMNSIPCAMADGTLSYNLNDAQPVLAANSKSDLLSKDVAAKLMITLIDAKVNTTTLTAIDKYNVVFAFLNSLKPGTVNAQPLIALMILWFTADANHYIADQNAEGGGDMLLVRTANRYTTVTCSTLKTYGGQTWGATVNMGTYNDMRQFIILNVDNVYANGNIYITALTQTEKENIIDNIIKAAGQWNTIGGGGTQSTCASTILNSAGILGTISKAAISIEQSAQNFLISTISGIFSKSGAVVSPTGGSTATNGANSADVGSGGIDASEAASLLELAA